MAALVCDICGGKLIMGTKGTATCDSCGMEFTLERMQEKIKEIKGTVRIDNSHMIDNYYSLAENEYAAKNYEDAETYCNKIIEIDNSSSKAWLLKGKCNNRQLIVDSAGSGNYASELNQITSCFLKAIELSPSTEVEQAKDNAMDALKNLISSLTYKISHFCNSIQVNDRLQELYKEQINVILSAVNLFAPVAPTHVKAIQEEMAKILNNVAVEIWEEIDEQVDRDYDNLSIYIDNIDNCIALLEKANVLSDNDKDEQIQRYKNLVFLHTKAVEFSNTPIPEDDNNVDNFFSKEELFNRQQIIKMYQEKIYWIDRMEEKQALDAEKKSLDAQLFNLALEIEKLPESAKLKQLQEKINNLKSQKSTLGIFKGKEKKEIQIQIDQLNDEAKIATEKINVEIANIKLRIEPVQNRLNEINQRLDMAKGLIIYKPIYFEINETTT